MVAQAEREFLARVARINQALAATALPLINDTLDSDDSHRLGVELIVIGQEFLRRAYRTLDTGVSVDVIDGETVPAIDSPQGIFTKEPVMTRPPPQPPRKPDPGNRWVRIHRPADELMDDS